MMVMGIIFSKIKTQNDYFSKIKTQNQKQNQFSKIKTQIKTQIKTKNQKSETKFIEFGLRPTMRWKKPVLQFRSPKKIIIIRFLKIKTQNEKNNYFSKSKLKSKLKIKTKNQNSNQN